MTTRILYPVCHECGSRHHEAIACVSGTLASSLDELGPSGDGSGRVPPFASVDQRDDAPLSESPVDAESASWNGARRGRR